MKCIADQILQARCSSIKKIKQKLHNILEATASRYNCVIIVNNMNDMALDLIANGAIPKKHTIPYRTQKSGLVGGYIILDDVQLNGLYCQEIYAQHHNETVYFIKTTEGILPTTSYDESALIKGLANSNGQFITADLDIVMLSYSDKSDKNLLSAEYDMGTMLKYEYEISHSINMAFTQDIRFSHHNIIRLITHGPLNRYARAKLSDINFPITVYHPTHKYFVLGNENERTLSLSQLFMLCNQLNHQGYHIDVQNCWKS